MEKERLTLRELSDRSDWSEAVVVFTSDSFDEEYSEMDRSYKINSNAKYFSNITIGNSLFGDCLDGNDTGVRLDYYLSAGWKVEYCYITKTKTQKEWEQHALIVQATHVLSRMGWRFVFTHGRLTAYKHDGEYYQFDNMRDLALHLNSVIREMEDYNEKLIIGI